MNGQFNGGVARVASLTEAMELTPQELQYSVRSMLNENIMASEPEAMLAWMSEFQSEEFPKAIIKWAEMDMTAAANWLNEQAPSPARDQALAKFSTEASGLDPEAASEWAAEIQDQQLREKTLQQIQKR